MDDYTHTNTHALDRWKDNGAGVFCSVRLAAVVPPLLSRLKPEVKERRMRDGSRR